MHFQPFLVILCLLQAFYGTFDMCIITFRYERFIVDCNPNYHFALEVHIITKAVFQHIFPDTLHFGDTL